MKVFTKSLSSRTHVSPVHHCLQDQTTGQQQYITDNLLF
jgi:hypothetical protein